MREEGRIALGPEGTQAVAMTPDWPIWSRMVITPYHQP